MNTIKSAEEILDQYDSFNDEVWRFAAIEAIHAYHSQFSNEGNEKEKSRIEGVLLGLKICKEMWAQGTISHENIYEHEILYKEELEKLKKEQPAVNSNAVGDDADTLSIDELLSEFQRQGFNTENWDGEEGAEKAIVDGVVNWIKAHQPIAVGDEKHFPMPSEWIEEFKINWFKDNNSASKKILNETWKEHERFINMIYKYQRRAFEKQPINKVNDVSYVAPEFRTFEEYIEQNNNVNDVEDKNLKCEGSCEEHNGIVRKVKVIGLGFEDGMHFNYCEEAIKEDVRRGFLIEIL